MKRLKNLKIGESIVIANYTFQDLEKAIQILDMKEGEDYQHAYKRMAQKYHPDRGGNEQLMKNINWAKDVWKTLWNQ